MSHGGPRRPLVLACQCLNVQQLISFALWQATAVRFIG